MHQMQFDFNGDSVMGFCSEKGKGMGWSLEGHEWNSPKEINDSTVKIMMAYFYCHTKGIFTDRHKHWAWMKGMGLRLYLDYECMGAGSSLAV